MHTEQADRHLSPEDLPMHTEQADRHLSPEDLAEREGVPVTTVYQWNRLGTGPPYMRIGKHARYRLADVITWEDSKYAVREAS